MIKSILDTIGDIIPLQKQGNNFVGICPFHEEKTPSLIVSEEKQTWHCFGCGLGGDGKFFIEKYNNNRGIYE